jgi:hypothetical protein
MVAIEVAVLCSAELDPSAVIELSGMQPFIEMGSITAISR